MRWGYKAAQLLCQAIWRVAFRLEVRGMENVPPEGQGVLLASNHQSFLDPVTVGVPLRREINPVARQSLFEFPLFRALIRYLNAFPIQRSTADMAAVREGIRRLRRGDALVLFPEGTRTRDGSIGRITPGFALIAQKARVPIVPVLIDGAFKCWPRGNLLPRPGRMSVTFGAPITPAEQAGRGSRETAALLKERLTHLKRERERLGG
jgi:1-acyl-sn-glycerol-3-phosphate acyltransferase